MLSLSEFIHSLLNYMTAKHPCFHSLSSPLCLKMTANTHTFTLRVHSFLNWVCSLLNGSKTGTLSLSDEQWQVKKHTSVTPCWPTARPGTALYKSTRCPNSGIAFISDLMQRYSLRTVMRATQMTFTIHHQNVWGMCPLKSQQPRKWPRCTVAAKSRHCFVRPTTSHMTNALQPTKCVLLSFKLLLVVF